MCRPECPCGPLPGESPEDFASSFRFPPRLPAEAPPAPTTDPSVDDWRRTFEEYRK